MPLGNSPQLQIPLMAENDNQKYLAFNDAIQALDDSLNRLLVLDFSAADVTLTESQFTRYQCFRGTGHTIQRTLNIPATVGGSPAVTTNRFVIFDNRGNAAVVLTHGAGSVTVPATTVTLVYCDGTDVTAVASASGFDMGVREEGGLDFVNNPTFLNFVGNGVSAVLNGLGTDITVTLSEAQDDGVSQQTDTTFFNFTGTGVTVTPSGTGVEINVPGGSSGIDFEEEGAGVIAGATVANFIGQNVTVTNSGGDAQVTITAPAVQDESSSIAADPTFINFLGAGVTATANGTGIDVTVPGASSSGIDVEDAGVSIVTGASTLNFEGANVSVTDVSGDARVNVKAPTLQDETSPVQADPTFINFVGAGVTATASGTGVNVTIPGSSGTAIPVDDESVNVLTAATRLNFTGTGVTVTANGNTADIDIGGGGGAVAVEDEGAAILAAASTFNFTGPGVTVTNPSGNIAEVNISGGGGSNNGTAALYWEDLPLVNGDFEAGDASGWTTDVGSAVVIAPAGAYNQPENGSFVYTGGAGGSAQAAVSSYQDFDVSSDPNSFAYEATATLMKDFSDNDKAFIEVQLLDGSGNVISGDRQTDASVSVGQRPASVMVFSHPDQATLRVRIGVNRTDGTNNNAGVDNVNVRRATVSDPAADTATSEILKVVDFTANPAATLEVLDIDKYDEVQLILRNVVNGGNNLRMRLSTDGGATYDATAGNYPYRFDGTATGSQFNQPQFEIGGATVTDPQSNTVTVRNPGQLVPTSYEAAQFEGSVFEFNGFFDQPVVTNALQIFHSGAGNFTSGEVYVVGVRYSKGTSYSTPAAFHASNTLGTGSGGVQALENEVLDEGANYDTATGVFTAPAGGLYHFYGAAVISGGGATGNAYIRVNGVQQVRGHSFATGTQNDTHSVALTIRLSPGDTVDFETDFALAASTTAWNYFGGYMLNASTGNAPLPLINETNTSLASVQAHTNGYVVVDSPSLVTYTVNDDTLFNHDIGATITIEQAGAGAVSVVPNAGVTIRSSATTTTRTQYSVIMMTKVAPDTWTVTGDLAP